MTDAWVRDAEIRATEEERYTMAKWNIDRQHADVKLHEYEEDVVNDFDPVERPQHYGQGEIECIDYIQDFLSFNEYCGYLRGNIAKYLHRWRYKNGLEDLNKARWYMDRLIELETNGERLTPEERTDDFI